MNYNGWATMLSIMLVIFSLSMIGLIFESAWTLIAIAIISGLIILGLIGIGTNKSLDDE